MLRRSIGLFSKPLPEVTTRAAALPPKMPPAPRICSTTPPMGIVWNPNAPVFFVVRPSTPSEREMRLAQELPFDSVMPKKGYHT